MADASVAYFRRLFEYERESNTKSLASLDTVPAGRRNDPDFRRALDLHAHLAASRLMWLFRLGAEPAAPPSYNPANLSPDEVRALVQRMEERFAEYLHRLPESAMDEPREYDSMASGRFRNTMSEILTHLASHGWYHRGQIALLVRSLGGQPAMTEHMAWTRVSIPPRAATRAER